MNELDRFVKAQEKDYSVALEEIKNGKKRSHWIWYIFPQLEELGRSSIAKYYGIKGFEEAKAYLENDLLRSRLIEITSELYKIDGDISYILNSPDDMKLKSCMTLFNYVDSSIDIFQKVLDKFYNGEKDNNTLEYLRKKK